MALANELHDKGRAYLSASTSSMHTQHLCCCLCIISFASLCLSQPLHGVLRDVSTELLITGGLREQQYMMLRVTFSSALNKAGFWTQRSK